MSSHVAIAITSKGNLEEVQVSTPTPGPGEVLIRVHYAALIPFDTYQLDRGYLLTEKSYPHVIGFSASGLVKAVGEGVTDLKVGDRVCSTLLISEILNNIILLIRWLLSIILLRKIRPYKSILLSSAILSRRYVLPNSIVY